LNLLVVKRIHDFIKNPSAFVNNNLESTPNTGEPFPIDRNSLTQREQPVVGNVSEDDFTE
jgi:hypothetical protein